jgi:hypothetical protein
MHRLVGLIALAAIVGCGTSGPSRRELEERTLSVLNIEADRWNGEQDYQSSASDAWGRGLATSIEKGTLHYHLELRSSGPDGLPKNTDDIVVTRSKRHGETTAAKEAAKAVEEVASGAASGAIEGIKKGLGFGNKEKKEKEESARE